MPPIGSHPIVLPPESSSATPFIFKNLRVSLCRSRFCPAFLRKTLIREDRPGERGVAEGEKFTPNSSAPPERAPAALAALAFAGGILLASHAWRPPSWWAVALLSLLLPPSSSGEGMWWRRWR